jgi:hypothetical protein
MSLHAIVLRHRYIFLILLKLHLLNLNLCVMSVDLQFVHFMLQIQWWVIQRLMCSFKIKTTISRTKSWCQNWRLWYLYSHPRCFKRFDCHMVNMIFINMSCIYRGPGQGSWNHANTYLCVICLLKTLIFEQNSQQNRRSHRGTRMFNFSSLLFIYRTLYRRTTQAWCAPHILRLTWSNSTIRIVCRYSKTTIDVKIGL